MLTRLQKKNIEQKKNLEYYEKYNFGSWRINRRTPDSHDIWDKKYKKMIIREAESIILCVPNLAFRYFFLMVG